MRKLVYILVDLLGAIFIVSGILKSVNTGAFGIEVAQYVYAYFAPWMMQWRDELALIVCAGEIIIGFLAFRRQYQDMLCIVYFVVLTFFLLLTGINYLCPSETGRVESCGCFGEFIHFTPELSFYKSVALWLLSATSLGLRFRALRLPKVKNCLQDAFFYISCFCGILLPAYSLFFIDKLTEKVYLSIFILLTLLLAFIVISFLRIEKLRSKSV